MSGLSISEHLGLIAARFGCTCADLWEVARAETLTEIADERWEAIAVHVMSAASEGHADRITAADNIEFAADMSDPFGDQIAWQAAGIFLGSQPLEPEWSDGDLRGANWLLLGYRLARTVPAATWEARDDGSWWATISDPRAAVALEAVIRPRRVYGSPNLVDGYFAQVGQAGSYEHHGHNAGTFRGRPYDSGRGWTVYAARVDIEQAADRMFAKPANWRDQHHRLVHPDLPRDADKTKTVTLPTVLDVIFGVGGFVGMPHGFDNEDGRPMASTARTLTSLVLCHSGRPLPCALDRQVTDHEVASDLLAEGVRFDEQTARVLAAYDSAAPDKRWQAAKAAVRSSLPFDGVWAFFPDDFNDLSRFAAWCTHWVVDNRPLPPQPTNPLADDVERDLRPAVFAFAPLDESYPSAWAVPFFDVPTDVPLDVDVALVSDPEMLTRWLTEHHGTSIQAQAHTQGWWIVEDDFAVFDVAARTAGIVAEKLGRHVTGTAWFAAAAVAHLPVCLRSDDGATKVAADRWADLDYRIEQAAQAAAWATIKSANTPRGEWAALPLRFWYDQAHQTARPTG